MDIYAPIASARLSYSSKNALKTGNFTTFADLLVTPLNEVVRSCRISAQDAKAIFDTLLKECGPLSLPSLDTLDLPIDDIFSTGDAALDQALNGGIRTGMVWEIVGESAAGKSQLALQLSLFVQNPTTMGGLNGAVCYLTTSSILPTSRIDQILQSNRNLSQQNCSLSHIHTINVSTTSILMNILTNLLPNFIKQNLSSPYPVKLLIIDALTELFHSDEKTTKSTLFDRSKELNRLSSTLHALATTHNIAVIIINEVIDRFERGTGARPNRGDLLYSEQSRYFNTCDSVPGEGTKEASLGLVWANQINARIMMSRTRRRRYLDANELQQKKLRLESNLPYSAPSDPSSHTEDQSTLIRRLSIIFSSVSPSVSLDYIVAHEGICVLPDESLQEEAKPVDYRFSEVQEDTFGQTEQTPASQLQETPDEEDEYDRLLNTDELSYDAYDAFEFQLTQPAPT